MSKITFRADDDLVERLEEFDVSKSEVMRRALRAYVDEAEGPSDSSDGPAEGSLDEFVRERVDELIAERLEATPAAQPAYTQPEPRDINVNVAVDGVSTEDSEAEAEADAEPRKTRTTTGGDASDTERKQCGQCGDTLEPSAVYCSNCGEKASHRVFCDCGDELRSDWSFCPSCGRRTPAADVLDQP
jgi:hypothetical protein